MDVEAVRECARRSRRVVEAEPELDERNTRAKLVRPLIEALGWDVYSEAVELEYPVRIGSRRVRVDYALKVGGSPAAFVEAKASREDLSESDADQLRSYMRGAVDVEWGLLTNGRSFEVLAAPDDGGSRETTVAAFDLADLAATPRLLERLARSSVRAERSAGVGGAVARHDAAARRLRRNREAVVASVAGALDEHVEGDVPVDVERRAGALVEDVVAALEERPTPADPVAVDAAGPSGEGGSAGGSGVGTAGDRSDPPGSPTDARSAGPRPSGPGPDGDPDGGSPGPSVAEPTTGDDRAPTGRFAPEDAPSAASGGSPAGDGAGWVPAPDAGVGAIDRADLAGAPGETVAIVPVATPDFEFDPADAVRSTGVAGSPAFVAAHVGGGRGAIQYVGRVEAVVPAGEVDPSPVGTDLTVGDRVVRLEPGGLRELADPIPAGRRHPRSVRYTDVGSFRRAATTDDLL